MTDCDDIVVVVVVELCTVVEETDCDILLREDDVGWDALKNQFGFEKQKNDESQMDFTWYLIEEHVDFENLNCFAYDKQKNQLLVQEFVQPFC